MAERWAYKTAYAHRVERRALFGMAGLYDTWVDSEGERFHTCTIITTPPKSLLAPIHDRMPAILTDDAVGVWLDPSIQDSLKLLSLLKPYAAEAMAYPVSSELFAPRTTPSHDLFSS